MHRSRPDDKETNYTDYTSKRSGVREYHKTGALQPRRQAHGRKRVGAQGLLQAFVPVLYLVALAKNGNGSLQFQSESAFTAPVKITGRDSIKSTGAMFALSFYSSLGPIRALFGSRGYSTLVPVGHGPKWRAKTIESFIRLLTSRFGGKKRLGYAARDKKKSLRE
jgi:hypothetical protein